MNYEQDQPDWQSPDADPEFGRSRRGYGRGHGHGGHREPGPGPEDERLAEGPRGYRGKGTGRRGFGPGGPWQGNPGDPSSGGPGRGFRGRWRVRRGDVRLAILALLTEGPLNGYQVIQALDERTNGLWKPSPGAVYPALSQLEDEGLVEPFDNAGQKAFRLTESGHAAAAVVDPKPWDLVNAEAGAHGNDHDTLWREFGALAPAVKAVMASGSVQQIQAATQAVADTRKRLFGLLAEDPDRP